jgi:Domain of unknown function (DUF2017)
MPRQPKPPVQRIGDTYSINLDIDELELIHRLMLELRQLLNAPEPDDRLKRLFPVAYHSEADRELDEEYQRLMRDELMASRLKGLDVVDEFMAGGLQHQRLTEAELLAFLQALNSVRLVLGTILDVTEDHDVDDVDERDPMASEYQLYDFLSWVLDWSVRALQR